MTGFMDGAGSSAEFDALDIKTDKAGNIYVADNGNNRVREITPAGLVSTFAGDGTGGLINGTGINTQFYGPSGVVVDPSGNVYVSDYYNECIRKITAAGVVTTYAGGSGFGNTDGPAATALFRGTNGLALDAAGNLYVVDTDNSTIRKITPAGIVSTIAGDGKPGFKDGAALSAEFYTPLGIGLDGAGNIYVADDQNNRIRKITPGGIVSTLAGNGAAAFVDSTVGADASFNAPYGITVTADGTVYVADGSNQRIRKVTVAGAVSTVAGNGIAGNVDGAGTAAELYYPIGITLDPSGNMYVLDSDNRIRKITFQ